MKRPQQRFSKLKTVTVATTLAFSSQVLGIESLEVGITAYQEKQYNKSLEIFHHYAEKLEPKAQYYLSMLSRLGLGVELDEDEAFLWCKRAADAGALDAQYQLGIMYLQGEGKEEDAVMALEWLWKATDRGHFAMLMKHSTYAHRRLTSSTG